MSTTDPREFAYRLDRRDRIESVSPQWIAFAEENHWDAVKTANVVGRPIWSFIRGMETQSIYRALFAAIRGRGATLTLPFRCDSPSTRRYMELRISPGGGGALELVGRLIRAEPRLYLAILDSQLPRREPRVELCSFCKRVHVAGRGWFELDDPRAGLDLFTAEVPPRVDHGVCDDCADATALRAADCPSAGTAC